MLKRLIVGIDIGGTYTDAVLVDNDQKIVAAAKSPTTECIVDGVRAALAAALEGTSIMPSDIGKICIGTTHATNAILQQKDLYRVGVLRLTSQQVPPPPCFGWPPGLVQAIYAASETVDGGVNCDGSLIAALDERNIASAIHRLIQGGAEAIAVVGVFSPLYPQQEQRVGEIVASLLGASFPYTISSEIGGVGFIERENASILNAALKKVIGKGFEQVQKALREMGFTAPIYITQNNGSLVDIHHALRYPVLTISAGPTNSFIGAAKLLGKADAIVVDIGGTSTDVGLIEGGFPRRSLNVSEIGGVKLNFTMPDVLSIPLGGASYVDAASGRIGPKGAGRELLSQARCFGGDRLTLTDVAVAHGHFAVEGARPENVELTSEQARTLLADALATIAEEVSIVQGSHKRLPVLLVGGGSRLLPLPLLEDRYIIPENAHVANAFGAALAEVAGCIDTVVSLNDRKSTLEKLKSEAIQKAVDAGADRASVKIVDLEILPYHYIPGQKARVLVTASGKHAI